MAVINKKNNNPYPVAFGQISKRDFAKLNDSKFRAEHKRRVNNLANKYRCKVEVFQTPNER